MATNKFATMLHKNTNKPTMVLVYALLEWILIVLLLLNSLFSYFILKFSDYFGLKRPCICCSRIEHIIESKNCTDKSCFRDLVCESHATEISKLGYCYNHSKLAESEDMCEDCLSSSSHELDYVKIAQSFGFFSWMKKQKTDMALKCSCCGVHMESRLLPPWDHHAQMQNLITQGGIEVGSDVDEGDEYDHSRSDCALDHHEHEDIMGTHKVSYVDQTCDAKTREIAPQHLEFTIHGDNCNLIPFELIESSSSATASKARNRHPYMVVEEGTEIDDGNEDVILDFDMLSGGVETEPVFENWHTSGDSVIDFSCRKRKPKALMEQKNVGSLVEEKPIYHNLLEVHVESKEGCLNIFLSIS